MSNHKIPEESIVYSSSQVITFSESEHRNMRLCSGVRSPPYSADTMDVKDQDEICYLYQHIFNHRADRALEWMQMHCSDLIKLKDAESIAYELVKQDMNELLNWMVEKQLVTTESITEHKTYWSDLKKQASKS